MRREVFPGGTYCDALPGGPRVVSYPHSDAPGGWPLFVRLHPAGVRYAFVSHEGLQKDRCFEYEPGGFTDHGPACGPNAVIYKPDGHLRINVDCSAGTQGFRCYDGDELLLGDATYDGRGTTGLAEWSRHGDVTIGQSYIANDACTILYQGVRRILELGYCRFIRFNRQGSQCSAAMWKMQENCAVIVWFDVSEIAGLPLEETSTPKPPTPPEPPHPPKPPEPPPMNEIAHVRRIRAHYPTPLGPRHAEFLQEVALAIGNGAGLLLKGPPGTHITLPGGTNVAQDIICYPDGTIYDILKDGEGQAVPLWGVANGSPVDPARYYKVGSAIPPIDPPPDNPPPPPDVDLQPILNRLAALELVAKAHNAELAALVEHSENVNADLSSIHSDVIKLKSQKYKVDIGKAWGHAHPATVIIEPQS